MKLAQKNKTLIIPIKNTSMVKKSTLTITLSFGEEKIIIVDKKEL